MPDAYISQFSGEEIDSTLRAAQIITGADTPAELRKKLEIRGDTIPVSAADPTPVSEALTASGGGVNPNLLDNWYFGRPVNQRGGYIIPAGVGYNDLSWNHAGTTDKAYPVIGYTGQDPLITVNGTNYIVGKSAQVPGYCAVGYTVDRWRMAFDSGSSSLQLTNDGVIYNAGSSGGYENFSQPYLKESCIVGQLYTISFLVDNFQNVNQLFNTKTGSNFDITENLISYTFSYNSTPDANPDIGIQFKKGTSTLIKAAKLELGDVQTLAHKEGDKWVLNEIPDYGEQLRRCTYYAEKVESKDTPAITNSTFVPSGATSAVFILPYARKRTVPAINFNDVSNYRIIARSISGGTTAFSVTAISLLDIGRTKAAILVSFNATDQGYYCFLQRSDNAPAGYAFISADL